MRPWGWQVVGVWLLNLVCWQLLGLAPDCPPLHQHKPHQTRRITRTLLLQDFLPSISLIQIRHHFLHRPVSVLSHSPRETPPFVTSIYCRCCATIKWRTLQWKKQTSHTPPSKVCSCARQPQIRPHATTHTDHQQMAGSVRLTRCGLAKP